MFNDQQHDGPLENAPLTSTEPPSAAAPSASRGPFGGGTMLGQVAARIGPGALQRRILQRRQKGPNETGLPDRLKSGVEALSGMSLDHVKVHYNSAEPAQLHAHAYAQGGDIHLGPGQEQHLPHEAWHVVQQAQGRVNPTMQMKAGVEVNDDKALEHEADVMGQKALGATDQQNATGLDSPRVGSVVAQREPFVNMNDFKNVDIGAWSAERLKSAIDHNNFETPADLAIMKEVFNRKQQEEAVPLSSQMATWIGGTMAAASQGLNSWWQGGQGQEAAPVVPRHDREEKGKGVAADSMTTAAKMGLNLATGGISGYADTALQIGELTKQLHELTSIRDAWMQQQGQIHTSDEREKFNDTNPADLLRAISAIIDGLRAQILVAQPLGVFIPGTSAVADWLSDKDKNVAIVQGYQKRGNQWASAVLSALTPLMTKLRRQRYQEIPEDPGLKDMSPPILNPTSYQRQ